MRAEGALKDVYVREVVESKGDREVNNWDAVRRKANLLELLAIQCKVGLEAMAYILARGRMIE